MTDIRDACQYLDRGHMCERDSDIIFYGIGLCDEHYNHASSTFHHITDFLPARLPLELRAQLKQTQHENNHRT